VHFLRLIEDVETYNSHKAMASDEYLQLSRFLWSIRHCEPSEQILHELNMLGIEGELPAEDEDFSETYRIWRMFLQMAYWRD